MIKRGQRGKGGGGIGKGMKGIYLATDGGGKENKNKTRPERYYSDTKENKRKTFGWIQLDR